jgi:hypothetical protein
MRNNLVSGQNVRIKQTYDPANPSAPINLLLRQTAPGQQQPSTTTPKYHQQQSTVDQLFGSVGGYPPASLASVLGHKKFGLPPPTPAQQYVPPTYQHIQQRDQQLLELRKQQQLGHVRNASPWKVQATSSQQFADAM